MRTYETTFILGPQADEATFDRQVKAVSDLITNNQGKIHKEERIGIRRLAYPIKKYTQGYYTRFIYEANNTVLSELERFFKLEEQYIRFLTVVQEGKIDPYEDSHSSHRHELQEEGRPMTPRGPEVVEPQVFDSAESAAEEKEIPPVSDKLETELPDESDAYENDER